MTCTECITLSQPGPCTTPALPDVIKHLTECLPCVSWFILSGFTLHDRAIVTDDDKKLHREQVLTLVQKIIAAIMKERP